MFGAGGIYNGLLYCFLIGAVLPIPVYFLRKRVKALEYFHFRACLPFPPPSFGDIYTVQLCC
jgi:hypothetical protein